MCSRLLRSTSLVVCGENDRVEAVDTDGKIVFPPIGEVSQCVQRFFIVVVDDHRLSFSCPLNEDVRLTQSVDAFDVVDIVDGGAVAIAGFFNCTIATLSRRSRTVA